MIGSAVYVELRKALSSRTLWTTAVLVAVGVPILAGALTAAAKAGNEQILTQLGPLAQASDWQLLTGISAQVSAAGALLAFGVGLSWIFGREFVDGAVTGLFAQPVSRPTIALAKLCVYFFWAIAAAGALVVLIFAGGLVLGLPTADGVLIEHARQFVLVVLTAMLAAPAAWAATLGRGLLPGIAVTLLVLVTAQVVAIAAPHAAPWLPLAAPALWALFPDAVHAGQLALVLIVPAVFGVVTLLSWSRLQLDR